MIPELKGLAFLQTDAGYPVSRIVGDREWEGFLNETKEEISPENAWVPRGNQVPTVFNTTVLRKNLLPYSSSAAPTVEKLEKKKFAAAAMMVEGLEDVGCGQFNELTMSEAWLGSNDGRLERLDMKTSMGAIFSKLGESKERAMLYHGDYVIPLCDMDYHMVSDPDMPLYIWLSKMSLKDARIPVEKAMESKGRVFQAGAIVSTITGRRLIGDFIGRFMHACSQGAWIGIVSLVLMRGGWDTMMHDLGEVDYADRIELIKVFCGDLTKMDKNWLRSQHWWCCLIVGALASSKEHAQKIWRHYERVSCSPTLLTIYGFICMLTKGQPSGDIATVIFNTIILVLIYMLSYCKVAPKKYWFFKDFNENLRLKALGDDSASCLSAAMRSWLGSGGYTYEQLIVETFAEQNFEITIEEKTLGTIDFVGHTSVVARTKRGKVLLPALPGRVVMSINEWRKEPKNPDVYKEVANLSRYHASVERAFPYLWSEDKEMKDYFKLCYQWERKTKEKLIESSIAEIRANARGVPTLSELAELYFGYRISQAEIGDRLDDVPLQYECYKYKNKEGTVGFGAGFVPTHGEYCGPGHPKISDYSKEPVNAVDAVCREHDLCYDLGADRADCDGAMAQSLAAVPEAEEFYPRTYARFADFWMNLVGDTDNETLKDVIRKTANGRTREVEQAMRRMNVPGKLIKEYIPEVRKLAAKELSLEVEQKKTWGDLVEEELEIEEIVNHRPTKKMKGKENRPSRRRKVSDYVSKKRLAKVRKHNAKVLAKYSPQSKQNKGKSGAARRVAAKTAKKAAKKTVRKEIKRELGVGRPRKDAGFRAKRKNARSKAVRPTGNWVPARNLEKNWNVTRMRGKGRKGIILTGCEFLDVVRIDESKNVGGTMIYSKALAPFQFLNSRIRQFAPLFQRYRFKKFRVIYESSISEFYSGKLLHYIDTDPTADYTSINGSQQLIRNMSAHERDKPMKVCENSSAWMMQEDVPQSSYFMDWDETAPTRQFALQGAYFLALVNKVSTSTGAPSFPVEIGDLWIEYECEMYMDALDATGGFTGNSHTIDMHSGLQVVCWHFFDPDLGAVSPLVNKQPLEMLRSLLSEGSFEDIPPNVGTVAGNQIELQNDATNNCWIRGSAMGKRFMFSFELTVKAGSGSFPITTGLAIFPQTVVNCTIEDGPQADYSVNGVTLSTIAAVHGAWVITVTDESVPWAVELTTTTGYIITGLGTAVNCSVSAQLMCMQHYTTSTIELDGCQYKYLAVKQKKTLMDQLPKWQEKKACDKLDCPICPYAKLAGLSNLRQRIQSGMEKEAQLKEKYRNGVKWVEGPARVDETTGIITVDPADVKPGREKVFDYSPMSDDEAEEPSGEKYRTAVRFTPIVDTKQERRKSAGK